MVNLYWSVYKNLEKEVNILSNQIHFDDNQLTIYSVKISELLIRCSVEIEAISKELYYVLGGKEQINGDLYFDTHCIQLIEDKWLLSKKKLLVSASNFYFQNEENRILTPLLKANKRGTSSCDWKRAYQAVKHNRTQNLSKANLKNLIRALGALFILNIYYKDEVYNLERDSKAINFPLNMGSDIFAIKLHKWFCYDGKHNYMKKDDFDECIYLTKYTDNSLENYRKAIDEMMNKKRDLFFKHPKFLNYIKTNNVEKYDGNNLMYDVLGQEDYINTIRIASQNKIEEIINIPEFEAVINKNSI